MQEAEKATVLPSQEAEGEGDAFFLFPDDNAQFYVAGLSFSPSYTSEPTQNEIEDGALITDHVNLPPIQMSFNGAVTDIQSNREGAYDKDFIGVHVDFRERMIQARENREIIGIDAGPVRGIYSGIILDFTPSWDAESGHGMALFFDLSIQQIDTAKTAVKDLPPSEPIDMELFDQRNFTKPRAYKPRSTIKVTEAKQNERIEAMTRGDGRFAEGHDWARGKASE